MQVYNTYFIKKTRRKKNHLTNKPKKFHSTSFTVAPRSATDTVNVNIIVFREISVLYAVHIQIYIALTLTFYFVELYIRDFYTLIVIQTHFSWFFLSDEKIKIHFRFIIFCNKVRFSLRNFYNLYISDQRKLLYLQYKLLQ